MGYNLCNMGRFSSDNFYLILHALQNKVKREKEQHRVNSTKQTEQILQVKKHSVLVFRK